MVAHYSHKLTVPFMKRHEVWIKVELERDINMIKWQIMEYWWYGYQ